MGAVPQHLKCPQCRATGNHALPGLQWPITAAYMQSEMNSLHSELNSLHSVYHQLEESRWVGTTRPAPHMVVLLIACSRLTFHYPVRWAYFFSKRSTPSQLTWNGPVRRPLPNSLAASASPELQSMPMNSPSKRRACSIKQVALMTGIKDANNRR